MKVAAATFIQVAIQFLSFFCEQRTFMHTRSVVVTVAKSANLLPRNGGRVNIGMCQKRSVITDKKKGSRTRKTHEKRNVTKCFCMHKNTCGCYRDFGVAR